MVRASSELARNRIKRPPPPLSSGKEHLPVSGGDAALLERMRDVARRIISEVRALEKAIPATHRTPSRLAAWTGVNRSVCHRFLGAGDIQGEPLGVFRALPGVQGFDSTLRALARLRVDRARIARAQGAGAAYAELIGDAGGSQAKLICLTERLLQDESAGRLEDGSAERQRATRVSGFDAAAQIAGLHATATTLVYAARPDPLNRSHTAPAMLGASVQGVVGLHRRARHLPVVLTRNAAPESSGIDPVTFDRDAAIGWSPGTVLGVLCTDPLPAASVSKAGPTYITVLEPGSHVEGGPLSDRPSDIFIGGCYRIGIPREELPWHAVSMVQRIPSRWSVIDVYLHTDLGPSGEPEGGIFYVGSEGPVLEDPTPRWYDRIEMTLSPRVMGRGLGASASVRSPKQERAASLLFESMQWNPDEFMHVRLEIECPIWGTQQLLRTPISRPPA